MKTKKLPKTQQKVLAGMFVDIWYSAYDLGVSIATLNALHRKGLIEQESRVGEFIVRFRKK